MTPADMDGSEVDEAVPDQHRIIIQPSRHGDHMSLEDPEPSRNFEGSHGGWE